MLTQENGKFVLENEEKCVRIDELERRIMVKFEGDGDWVPRRALKREVQDLTEELESVRKQLQCAMGEFEKEILTKKCKGQMESQ